MSAYLLIETAGFMLSVGALCKKEHTHRCKSNAGEALWKLRSSAVLDEGKYHPVHESRKSEVEKAYQK